MSLIFNHRYFFTAILVTIWTVPFCQAQIPTAKLELGKNIDAWYDDVVGITNLEMMEGTYYPMPLQTPQQNQVYKKLAWTEGQIEYNGQWYGDVEMMYNIFSDQVILKNKGLPESMKRAVLPNQLLISSFKVFGDEFIKLTDTSTDSNSIQGFYQLLYSGNNLSLLIKWKKSQNINASYVQYDQESSVILLYKELYTNYKGERSLLKLFPSHKKEIKKYIKGNLGYLNKEADQKLVSAIKYCDQL